MNICLKIRFLGESSFESFSIGGNILTTCDVNYLQETTNISLGLLDNLTDIVYVFYYVTRIYHD
jgi:hypothetical protein